MGALALIPADLREIDGEPRVQDLRLAEVLGLENPVNIRKMIRKNIARLERHGPIFSSEEKFSGQRRGPAATIYYLNERQAYRLCMWSAAPNANVVQEQMADVFFDFRHGQMVVPTRSEIEFERFDRRLTALERLLSAHAMVLTPEFAQAARFAPPIMRLRHPDGSLRKQRNPRHYSIPGAREAVWRLHRQVTIAAAVEEINAEFGDGSISRTALGREWQRLDQVRCAE